MDVVPIVDSAYGIPTRAATRATAGSPSVCIIRVNPVGANTSGSAEGRPRIVVDVSTCGDVLQHPRLELDAGVRLPATGAARSRRPPRRRCSRRPRVVPAAGPAAAGPRSTRPGQASAPHDRRRHPCRTGDGARTIVAAAGRSWARATSRARAPRARPRARPSGRSRRGRPRRRPRTSTLGTDASWAPTGRTAAAAIDSDVMPIPTSAQASSGSAAASPQTPTDLPACRPASAVIAISCSTAGCQGSVRWARSVAIRSAAIVYCVRSLVPIERKSTTSSIRWASSAALGTSTITPALSPRSRTWPANSAASATVATIGAITQVSVPVSLRPPARSPSSWRSSSPGLPKDSRRPADAERGVLLARRGWRRRPACRSRRRGCGRRRSGPVAGAGLPNAVSTSP